MNRRFLRSFDVPLVASSAMLGTGADEYAPATSAIYPPLVFIAGLLIGSFVVWGSQQGTISDMKEKISKMNKQYQTKGT